VPKVTITRDVVFASESGVDLTLDIYRPESEGPTPTVIYLHGGAWMEGDKSADSENRLEPFASHGVALISANYRLISQATFPAQIHDVKGLVRWVRAHGHDYGLATEKLGIWGSSAGGTLGSLLALTEGDRDFEGSVGGNTSESSAVQAVVHWFGPTDLVSGSSRSWLEDIILPPALEPPLFGAKSIGDVKDAAWAASPIHRVSSSAPPFLISHGDRDRVLPFTETESLHTALSRAGARSTFLSIAGAGHEDHLFDSPANLAMTAAFFKAYLQDGDAE
jgi:acetyl esterase/lipase